MGRGNGIGRGVRSHRPGGGDPARRLHLPGFGHAGGGGVRGGPDRSLQPVPVRRFHLRRHRSGARGDLRLLRDHQERCPAGAAGDRRQHRAGGNASDPGANPYADGDSGVDANAYTDTHIRADAGSNCYADADTGSHSCADACSNRHAHANTDSHSRADGPDGSRVHLCADSNAGADSHARADCSAGSTAHTDADGNTQGNTDAAPRGNPGTGGDFDAGANSADRPGFPEYRGKPGRSRNLLRPPAHRTACRRG